MNIKLIIMVIVFVSLSFGVNAVIIDYPVPDRSTPDPPPTTPTTPSYSCGGSSIHNSVATVSRVVNYANEYYEFFNKCVPNTNNIDYYTCQGDPNRIGYPGAALLFNRNTCPPGEGCFAYPLGDSGSRCDEKTIPTVSITKSGGATIFPVGTTVSGSASASDASGIDSLWIQKGTSGNIKDCGAATYCTYSYTTTSSDIGDISFRARATDKSWARNTGYSSSFSVTVVAATTCSSPGQTCGTCCSPVKEGVYDLYYYCTSNGRCCRSDTAPFPEVWNGVECIQPQWKKVDPQPACQ